MEPGTKLYDPAVSTEKANAPSACDVEQLEPVTAEKKASQETVKDKLEQSLTCPICITICAPPTQSCVNGHLICASCRLKASQCPVCCVQYGTQNKLTRVLALENMAQFAGIKCNCPNALHGCPEMLEYDAEKVRMHVKRCPFYVTTCPICAVEVLGKSFTRHYKEAKEPKDGAKAYHYFSANISYSILDLQKCGQYGYRLPDHVLFENNFLVDVRMDSRHVYFYARHVELPPDENKWWCCTVTLHVDDCLPQSFKFFTIRVDAPKTENNELYWKVELDYIQKAKKATASFSVTAVDISECAPGTFTKYY